MRGVADGEGRGNESEEGEGEVEDIVQQIAVVALFEVEGGAKVSTGDTKGFLAS